MKYYVNGSPVEIDTTKKPYGEGSEARLYKKGDTLYKIYFQQALNDGFGNKEKYHKQLKEIKTRQVKLVDDLIFEEDGKYLGYTVKEIKHDKKKQNGIIELPKTSLIKNLCVLEEDFDILSNHCVLVSDVRPYNHIYASDGKMYEIDCGRYRTLPYLSNTRRYQEDNNKQLIELITLLIYNDLINKRVGTKRKIQIFRDRLLEEKASTRYSDFFNDLLQNNQTVEEYAREKIKFIK